MQTTYCSKCGGFIEGFYGGSTTYPTYRCQCPKEYYTKIGWKCPRCHKVNSPSKMQCECVGNIDEVVLPKV